MMKNYKKLQQASKMFLRKQVFVLLCLLLSGGLYAQDITSNLILQYTFEELVDGKVPDVTGITGAGILERNAKIENEMLDLTVSQGTNRQNSNALKLPDNFTQDLTDFTVSTWVKTANPSSWGRIFDFGGSTQNYFFFANNRLGIKNNNGTEQTLIMTSGIPMNEWTHVAVTYKFNNATSNATAIIYKDGVAVGTKSDITYTPAGMGATTLNYISKAQFSNDPGLNGYMRDFRIYNRSLPASDVKALSEVIVCPKLGSSSSSIELSYFNDEKTVKIFSNGSGKDITFLTPSGIEVLPAKLPATGGLITISSPDYVNGASEIAVKQDNDEIKIAVSGDFPEGFMPTQKLDTLTTNGSWCWFADPRSIYHKGTKEQTYFCWVANNGDIVVASYNHETKAYNQYTVMEKFQEDDHANPSLLIRKDGRLIVFIAAHFGDKIHRFITTNPEDITSWGEDYKFSNTVTYPYPFQVGDSICVFYRGGADWHPRLSVSTDNGQTFDDGRLFIEGGGQRPYTRYCQGPDGSIHVAVTTGHPRNESANKIHYCRLKDNKVYRADGTLIADVTSSPVNLNQLEVVYNGTSYGRGWIWDITLEPETGYPVLVYASFPSSEDHRYHYARWTGTSWFNKQITEAGKWFPQTPEGAGEPEPNYSGGIILDYDDPSVVYLSKQVKGVFEIFKYTTADKGETWDIKALTWNTPSHLVNVRPIIPRHHQKGFFDVIWMRGTYVFYASQQYLTALVFPKASAETPLTGIELSSKSLNLISDESHQLTVYSIPAFASTGTITWKSSEPEIATVENGKVTALSEGTTTITATTHSGFSANCEINVKTVVYLTDVFFDFGTTTSPVATGATKVTETTLLGNSFGWLKAVSSRDRSSNADPELRDFNLSSAKTIFKVYLENGEYKVTVKQGDYDFRHDNMNLKVNGESKLTNITNALGSIEVNSFYLNIDKRYAEFEFSDGGGNDANWVVNSIILEKQLLSGINSAEISLLGNPLTIVTVFDLYGRKIFREKLRNRDIYGLFNANISQRGIYLISLELNDKRETMKYMYLPN